jgi:hypothetical protein
MWSELISCRNHLSFFTGKGAKALDKHPFGTIKRQWGFSYILTKKGISLASVDTGFMFIEYNLRRIVNILTQDHLIEYLRVLVSKFSGKTEHFWLNNNLWKTTFSRQSVWDRKFPGSLVAA